MIQSVLVTPNFRGTDGISALSRQIARALPQPVVVLSLHDSDAARLKACAADATDAPLKARGSDADIVRGAGGSRSRLLALAARVSAECGRDTLVMSTHLHLAPIARLIAWRGASVANVLCGIEAWVPLRAAERWALASGELIAISHHTERRFKAANPEFAAAHVSVVHPGLPPSFGSPAVAPNPRPMALIVGRMAKEEAYKGHDLLIDIWPHVLSRHPNAELCMVGDGTDRLRLEDKAAQAGLIGPVTFTGRVDDRTLDRLYRQCTFFVMPSRDEGFGLVFVEAMRAGKACIGGHGAAAEIIQHGTTGFVVDPRNGDDVAAAVLRLLDEPGTCRAMGAAGRARYLSTFTDEQFQHRLMRAVNQEAA